MLKLRADIQVIRQSNIEPFICLNKMSESRKHDALVSSLDTRLKRKLKSLFSMDILELRRISLDSPKSILVWI